LLTYSKREEAKRLTAHGCPITISPIAAVASRRYALQLEQDRFAGWEKGKKGRSLNRSKRDDTLIAITQSALSTTSNAQHDLIELHSLSSTLLNKQIRDPCMPARRLS